MYSDDLDKRIVREKRVVVIGFLPVLTGGGDGKVRFGKYARQDLNLRPSVSSRYEFPRRLAAFVGWTVSSPCRPGLGGDRTVSAQKVGSPE